MLVRRTANAEETHLQWSINPVTTWCEKTFNDEAKVFRLRWGQLTCMGCLKRHQRVQEVLARHR